MAFVSLRNIHKQYPKGPTILRDLSLDVRDEEFLVLVGPSGCGKSTILRIVAGLEDVTAGTIRIGDRDVTQTAPKDRDIAMVFQNYALYPHMSAAQNIAFGLKLRGQPKATIEKRVQEAASILGIEPLLEKMPKALSGGERQRVALGRAIVRNPQVFLFDEPLSNLDAKLRSEMRAEITALHRRLRVTTLYVTHDQVEAMTMGERIVVLRSGVIQQAGEPLEIYRKPANRFVAGFIGNPPMNFLEARLEGDGLQIGGFLVPARPSLPLASGSTYTLGIRPEHMRLAPEGVLKGRVTLVEPTGGESFVYFDLDDGASGPSAEARSIIVRGDADGHVQVGDQVGVDLSLEHAHFFDPQTEERIQA